MALSPLSPPIEPPNLPSGLTPSQLQTFHKDGYLIIPHALTPSTTTSLLAETHSLLTSFSLTDHPLTKFTTGDSSPHIGDTYFLTSGNKIRYFFEEAAFNPTTNTLQKPAAQAINKIGHYLHALSPPFRTVTFSPLHKDIARALGFRDPRVLQ
ncbi:MAG: hypothetical protein Q9164_006395, partial [Protoblastenia rupestris]